MAKIKPPKKTVVPETIRDLTQFEQRKSRVDPQFPKGTGFRDKPKAVKPPKGLLS